MSHTSFHPPARTLMGPGPSIVSPRVLAALSRPTIGHLDPDFVGMMESLKGLLQYAFQTDNALTLPISGPGSAGMECCFVNLIEPGDTVVVCRNGVFGGRMIENVERLGASAVVVENAWGEAVDPQALERTLEAHPEAKVVAFVHAETSTGARSDAATLAEIAGRAGCLTIVDTVTSLGGSALYVDDWGLDAVYSGSQKCLSCVPGLSPVSFSERAVARIASRKTPVPSWFLDLRLVMGYWGEGATRSYHHTAPVNSLYALHEALTMLREEGLEQAWARHRHHHEALAAGVRALGLDFLVAAEDRLSQLNAILVPDGLDESLLRRQLLDDFALEIGAGLGPYAGRIVRIGLMGEASRPQHVLQCLGALGTALRAQGHDCSADAAIAAAREVLASPVASHTDKPRVATA
jgi:alanine-glyoxylate transaminase/serine-glyoxylate transaminase/serine-pyruvate transaminase